MHRHLGEGRETWVLCNIVILRKSLEPFSRVQVQADEICPRIRVRTPDTFVYGYVWYK